MCWTVYDTTVLSNNNHCVVLYRTAENARWSLDSGERGNSGRTLTSAPLLRMKGKGWLRWLCRTLYPDAQTRLISPPSDAKATVVLLGWGGSRPRNLRRIEEWYVKEKHVQVVSFIMPLWAPGFVRDALVSDVKDTLLKHSSSAPKLLLHSYSNNGAWVYAELLRENLRFDKLAFDSAPWFYYTFPSVFEEAALLTRVATSVALRGNTYHHSVVSPILHSLLFLGCGASRLLFNLQTLIFANPHRQPIVKDLASLSRTLRDESPKDTPHLFLYTETDELLPHPHILEFVGLLKNRGVNVSSFGWPSGPHTSAFWAHHVDYTARLSKFFEI